MLPDVFLFYGYSTFLLMAAYKASYQGSLTSPWLLYLPIIVGETFCISTFILTIVVAYIKEAQWTKKMDNLSHLIDTEPPSDWSASAVSWWLTEVMGMGHYGAICGSQLVTGRRLQEMSKIELEQLGIKSSIHRKRIKLSLLLLSSVRKNSQNVHCDIIDPWNEADEGLKSEYLWLQLNMTFY